MDNAVPQDDSGTPDNKVDSDMLYGDQPVANDAVVIILSIQHPLVVSD